VRTGPNSWERRWTIPPAAQPLLEEAQADRDQRVRDAANRVGRQDITSFGSGCIF
jgi:hypothetical protein